MTRDSPEELFAPVAGVAEVTVDGARRDLADQGQAAIVLGGLDFREDRADQPLLQNSGRSLDPLQHEVDTLQIKGFWIEAPADPLQEALVVFML